MTTRPLPLVSIMIPCYNQATSIEKAIRSALDQDHPNLEIIISDDNSKDSTESIIQPFLNRANIRYFKQQESLGRVRNYRKLVFELAKGTYAINLDGDDFFVSKTFISKAVQKMEQNQNCVLVFGRQQFLDMESGRVWANPSPALPPQMKAKELLQTLPQLKEVMPHIASLYRRQTAIEANVFSDDIVFADAQALIKIASLGDSAYVNEIVGTWVRNGNNESYKPDFEKRVKNFLMVDEPAAFFKKHNIFSANEIEQWKRQMAKKLGRETACMYLDFRDQENYKKLITFLEAQYGAEVRHQVECDRRVRLRRWIPAFSKVSEQIKSFRLNKGLAKK